MLPVTRFHTAQRGDNRHQFPIPVQEPPSLPSAQEPLFPAKNFFSGFKGGIGVLLGTTGGYIVGFIFMGLIYWLMESLLGEKPALRIAALVIGLVVCYAFGTAWFLFVYARTSGAIGLGTALSWCVFPFILPDLVKMALAVMLSERVKKYLH